MSVQKGSGVSFKSNQSGSADVLRKTDGKHTFALEFHALNRDLSEVEDVVSSVEPVELVELVVVVNFSII